MPLIKKNPIVFSQPVAKEEKTYTDTVIVPEQTKEVRYTGSQLKTLIANLEKEIAVMDEIRAEKVAQKEKYQSILEGK